MKDSYLKMILTSTPINVVKNNAFPFGRAMSTEKFTHRKTKVVISNSIYYYNEKIRTSITIYKGPISNQFCNCIS